MGLAPSVYQWFSAGENREDRKTTYPKIIIKIKDPRFKAS